MENAWLHKCQHPLLDVGQGSCVPQESLVNPVPFSLLPLSTFTLTSGLLLCSFASSLPEAPQPAVTTVPGSALCARPLSGPWVPAMGENAAHLLDNCRVNTTQSSPYSSAVEALPGWFFGAAAWGYGNMFGKETKDRAGQFSDGFSGVQGGTAVPLWSLFTASLSSTSLISALLSSPSFAFLWVYSAGVCLDLY